MCVCVCVCVCVRARVRARAGVCMCVCAYVCVCAFGCCFVSANGLLVNVCQCCCLLMFVCLPLSRHFPCCKTWWIKNLNTENTGRCNSENRNAISDHRISFQLMLYFLLKNKNKKIALRLMKSHVDTSTWTLSRRQSERETVSGGGKNKQTVATTIRSHPPQLTSSQLWNREILTWLNSTTNSRNVYLH